MEDKIEALIRKVYQKYKLASPLIEGGHPDEEDFVSFIQGRLSGSDQAVLKKHILSCAVCSQAVASLALAGEDLKLETAPADLVFMAKGLVQNQPDNLLEIFLKLKENLLELARTSGDVLIGQEVVPAALLRSHNIKSFKDEINILKDFNGIRVEVKVENRNGSSFNLAVLVKEKQTSRIIKDLRITLLKDGLELESYLTQGGKVIFENIVPGEYSIEIANLEAKLAVIVLGVKP